jgi:hypothetical protein
MVGLANWRTERFAVVDAIRENIRVGGVNSQNGLDKYKKKKVGLQKKKNGFLTLYVICLDNPLSSPPAWVDFQAKRMT